MDVAAADAQGVDVRDASGKQVVALANPAGGGPGQGLTDQGPDLLRLVEQGLLHRGEGLGRAGEAPVQVGGDAVGLGLGHGAGDLVGDPGAGGLVGHAHIEAGHGQVRHHVQGRAPVDPGEVQGHPVPLSVQGVEPRRQPGGGGHGVATGGEVPTRMGCAAPHHHVEIARALARGGQGPGTHGRLVGQAQHGRLAECGQQRGRGNRADLLVRRQKHGVANPARQGVGLEGGEGAQHHADPPLHVGDARAVQGPVRPGDDLAEGRLRRIDGVVVAGQGHLDRGVGAHGQAKGVGMGLRSFPAIGGDFNGGG